MFDIKIDAQDPAQFYAELSDAAAGLVAGEGDPIANMANVAALIWHAVPDLNWAGFYRLIDGELVLGPFQGKPACIRIPLGKGVCGTAAATGLVQCIDDVHAFPGHIACDSASASELVVPLHKNGCIFGVFDLDSPKIARFTHSDAAGVKALIDRITPALSV